MDINQLLKPYNKNHSIREVIFTLFFNQPIEDFQSLLKLREELKKKGFDKFNTLRSKTFKINSNSFDIQHDDETDIGFYFSKENFNTNSIKQYCQIQNLENQRRSIFSFHELDYIRWADFKKDYLTISREICLNQEISNANVSALNLTYIDEFIWVGDTEIELDKIFCKNSGYLPIYFFNSYYPSVEIAALKNEKNSTEFLTERLVIDVQQTKPYSTISISHTIASTLENSPTLANLHSNDLEQYLEKTHRFNKETLYNLLNKDVQTLIQLPQTIN